MGKEQQYKLVDMYSKYSRFPGLFTSGDLYFHDTTPETQGIQAFSIVRSFGKVLINYRGDLSETFICSFSPDKTFERIRRNPKKYIQFFKRTAGLIGFDFSIHSDMPMVMQKSQIYDNLSLTYFYGTNGIPIIPNLRCGVDELLSEFLEAIPKGTLVAVGAHGCSNEKREKYEWYCFLETIIAKLNPSAIVVYGSLNGKLFDDFKKQANFIFFDPWIKQRFKEVTCGVN